MTDISFNDANLEQLLRSPSGPVARDLEARALRVEAAQKILLSEPGSGRIYRRRGVVHQASAPGQPPAVDTGLLRASISHQVSEDADGLYAEIGSGANPAAPGVKYAIYLEDGTRHMAPRPWARPSLSAAKDR